MQGAVCGADLAGFKAVLADFGEGVAVIAALVAGYDLITTGGRADTVIAREADLDVTFTITAVTIVGIVVVTLFSVA